MVFSGNGPIEIEGKTYRENRDRPNANFEQVTGGFFAVTGQRLLEGRTFTDRRSRRAPAGGHRQRRVRAEALRHRERARPPVPHRGRQRPPAGPVADDRRRRVDGPDARAVQQPGRRRHRLLRAVLREPVRSGPAGPLRQPVRDRHREAARRPARGRHGGAAPSAQSPRSIRTCRSTSSARRSSSIEGFVAQNRIIATMFSIFGVVAIVLASVGIYGVMSFSVNQRRQEFGVRMALGAHYSRILRMVLRQGAVQLALGSRARRRPGADAGHAGGRRHSEHPVRRQRPRSADLRDGHRGDHERVARGDAGARPPRHAGRSDDRAPRGIATTTPNDPTPHSQGKRFDRPGKGHQQACWPSFTPLFGPFPLGVGGWKLGVVVVVSRIAKYLLRTESSHQSLKRLSKGRLRCCKPCRLRGDPGRGQKFDDVKCRRSRGIGWRLHRREE